ncbi:hypothetical protein ACFQ22_07970 [Lentilactobacillus raoultii]|uniref:Uncharacterized protein n=1 Tax=Lentilactobacillus raoultii TaxID=1987503 RepID=A0ABW3PJV0_9LACO|nr:hypothetical protein [Lentilactobacillus raoultii]
MDLIKLIDQYQAAVVIRNAAAKKYRNQLHQKIDHIERLHHCTIDQIPDSDPLIKDLQRFANHCEPHLPPRKRRQLTSYHGKQRDELRKTVTDLLSLGLEPFQITYILGITPQAFWQIRFQAQTPQKLNDR